MPLKSWLRTALRRRESNNRGALEQQGFHSDAYLLSLVDAFAPRVSRFVETGTNLGSTARYIAEKHPALEIFTCEIDADAFASAHRVLSHYPQAHPYHLPSDAFLQELHRSHPQVFTQTSLFWLDAHSYGFRWPLEFELAFITEHAPSAIVMIDDFEVPGEPGFKYFKHGRKTCGMALLRESVSAKRSDYKMVLPTYRERTSDRHALVGVGTLLVGEDAAPGLELPAGFRFADPSSL